MGNIARLIAFAIMFLSICPYISLPVFADGMSVRWDPDSSAESQYIPEKSQYALINFEDGYQKIVIQVSIKASEFAAGQKSLWIFPIPSKPEDVQVDTLEGGDFPDIQGYFTRDMANLTIRKSFFITTATQLYPIPITYMSLYTEGDVIVYWEEGVYFGKYDPSTTPGNVTVYQHFEKYGLTTEIVTADNGAAMEEYFMSKDLTLPENANSLIDRYITKGYSFAASWGEGDEFLVEGDPGGIIFDLGVCLSFPTDEMFFPLVLTSVYGDEVIPIVIQIIDPVVLSPKNEGVDDLDVWIDYAYDDNVFVKDDLSDFFQEQTARAGIGQNDRYVKDDDPDEGAIGFDLDIPYTIVVIESSSDELVGDIWFIDEAPSYVATDIFIIENWFYLSLVLTPLLSILSSLVASVLVFRKFDPDKKKFAILGLANLLTIVGLAIVAERLEAHRRYVDLSVIDWNGDGKTKPKAPVSLLRFIVVFSFVFVAFSLLTHTAITLAV